MEKYFYTGNKEYINNETKRYIYSKGKKVKIIPEEYDINKDVHYIANDFTLWLNKLLNNRSALTIFNYILGQHPQYINEDRILRHELKHIEQQNDPFMPLKYLIEFFKKGYKKNPYEVEAREWQNKDDIKLQRYQSTIPFEEIKKRLNL